MTVRVTWLSLEERLQHEFAQLTEEGNDPGELRVAWAEVADATPEVRQDASARLLDRASEIMTPPQASAVPVAASPLLPLPGDLERRLLAGWTGRMAGCLLGKPVEKIPREGIRALLESAGRWPLDDYFTAAGVPGGVLERYPWNRASAPTSLRETIVCMPEDDDLNYTMLNLGVLESAGPDFSTEDIASAWLTLLPALTTFTAERVAYQNLLDRVQPPETALRRNPYREWIGAQIRADVWGWVNPGHPARAAEYAARDARLSHVNNGVWGEQYVAAMVAAACVLDDVSEVVHAGLAVVPEGSRLAGAVRCAVDLHSAQMPWEEALDRLYADYGQYHWVHTINNAALVTAALLYGEGDFGRSICLAVMGGWDTDSNGATVGSVVGTLRGEVPACWAQPLGGRVRSSLKGFDHATPGDLARRTAAQARRVHAASGGEG
ncbi:ADP-ribosylglycohydrolase family protein [Deinococcus frigens]|uniref:ADP-ribosylglycohydrolase family protein n=1 Tax=Deinococcus frigens TaxID=249403 RepID=UPI0005540B31|nr:ADP-ribosylglycohydrolase family protein [Deinococcus frigens]